MGVSVQCVFTPHTAYIHSIVLARFRASARSQPPRSSHKPLATTRRIPPRASQRVRIEGAQNRHLAPSWRRAAPISVAWWPPAAREEHARVREISCSKCCSAVSHRCQCLPRGAGGEGRGWVRVKTQKSSRATVSQAAHEQRDRCDERTTGAGALWWFLGAPGPAESITCHVRITPICVWYVGVAWSTRSAMAHHDSEVMRSFCPWHAPARPRFQEPAPILKPSRNEQN